MSRSASRRQETRTIEPELFLQSWRTMHDREVTKDEAGAGVKAAVATMKNLGCNLVALKMLRKLEEMERDSAAKTVRDLLVYAEWLGLGLQDQGELFPANSDLAGLTAKVTATHKEWEAERGGYEAGKTGDLSDNCPHQPGTNLYDRYMTGWHDGAATRKQQEKDGIIKPRQSSEGNPEDEQ